MNYENALSVLIALSAAFMGLTSVVIAWRHASRDRAMKEMSEYFELQTIAVKRQTEMLAREGKVIEEATRPETLNVDDLEKLSALTEEIAQSLDRSLNEKKAFESLIIQNRDTAAAYEKNISAARTALESIEVWRNSLSSLIRLVKQRQSTHG